jgi:hypothetical protein
MHGSVDAIILETIRHHAGEQATSGLGSRGRHVSS